MRQRVIKLFCLVCLMGAMGTVANAQPYKITFSQRTDVARYIQDLVKRYDFKKADLVKLFNKVKINPKVLANITAPFEGQPWYQYRAYFLSSKRIQQGAAYWRKHKASLAKAEKKYGVPAEMIVAILGVETLYGTHQGAYPVLDSLATLAFDYPPRSRFFRKELTQYLLLSREQKFDPTKLKGSYAGAIGQPQFMPSSYRYYAVDSTGNGHKDLVHTPSDAIYSIANYFKRHGWRTGEPVALSAKANQNHFKLLLKKDYKPKYSLSELKDYGITPRVSTQTSRRASVFSLTGLHNTQYWLGFNNFYVITRYNSSKLYAMAVFELSQEIARLYKTKKKV